MLAGVLVLVSLGSALGGVGIAYAIVRVRARQQLRQVHAEFEGRWRARFPGPMIVHRVRQLERKTDAGPDADEVFVARDGGEAFPLVRGRSPEEFEIHHLDL